MVQNHIRWSPVTCSCVIDIIVDSDTGDFTLFCIKNICSVHQAIATPDPDYENKKAAVLATRYQILDDNRNANYAQIDAYSDIQLLPKDKAVLKQQVDNITAERKLEYQALTLSSNLIFCTNVHDSVKEESGRWAKVYQRVQSFYGLTDTQMQTITWSFSGTPPSRVFTVNFYNLITNTQKTNLRNWCDSNIGVGRVVVL